MLDPEKSRFALPPSGSLRIIADIHGEIAAFDHAIAAAPASDFVLQLGDLVDCGPDSAACLRRALDLRASGRLIALRGNHEDRLARCLAGNPVRPGAELQRTLDQLRAQPNAETLIAAFLKAWPSTPWWVHRPPYLFVHGAFHPAMLDADIPDQIAPSRTRDKVKWLALYGEGQMGPDNDLPVRTYAWVDTVPANLTVVVGHDVRSETTPLAITGALGGRVIFLDTGCGKGGRLSCLDLANGGAEMFRTNDVPELKT